LWPSGTDRPSDGQAYSIKVYETNKVFTAVNGTELALRDCQGTPNQRFRCTLYEEHAGFVCEGADNGKGDYLAHADDDSLRVDGQVQRDNQYVYAKPHTDGGFMLYMKTNGVLKPVMQTLPEKKLCLFQVADPLRVSFKRLQNV
jgi:hypothetical protein